MTMVKLILKYRMTDSKSHSCCFPVQPLMENNARFLSGHMIILIFLQVFHKLNTIHLNESLLRVSHLNLKLKKVS